MLNESRIICAYCEFDRPTNEPDATLVEKVGARLIASALIVMAVVIFALAISG